MVRDLINRERIESRAMAMVVDREHDVRPGKSNGIFTIGVATAAARNQKRRAPIDLRESSGGRATAAGCKMKKLLSSEKL
jgi:phosphoglycolate phosphatase-like HAD superfamily hydrolase